MGEKLFEPLPGFVVESAVVGVELNFDAIRLEEKEYFPESDYIPQIRLTSRSTEGVKEVLKQYHGDKPEIEQATYSSSRFRARAYEEDSKVLVGLLADQLSFKFEEVIPGRDSHSSERTYEELVDDPNSAAAEVSWDAISNTHLDIEDELHEQIPDGVTDGEFTHSSYIDYTFGPVSDAVNAAGWSGGHAWLINLGIHELRNGRYQAAAYAFEGAKDGLTKHRLWDSSRLDSLLTRCLDTLRELCFLQSDTTHDTANIELFVEMENRDLIYDPKFLSEPSLCDQYFRFNTFSWVVNALMLTQAVAHAIGKPTISRAEVDPFGSSLTTRNITFTLSLASKLCENDPNDIDDPFQMLKDINFSRYSPDITVTRILRGAGYDIRYYGESNRSVSDTIGINYDYIVARGDQMFVVRALRSEDRDATTLKSHLQEVDDLDHQLMILYEREIDSSLTDIGDGEQISLNYIDLQSERLSPVESGFPQGFDSLTTTEEIQERIEELYEEASTAETTAEKGDSLESLVELIFEKAIPDTSVQSTNNRTRVEEIDLQLRNEEKRYPWKDLGSPINVECKNWSETVGVDVIYSAFGKAKATSPDCRCIILVCWEGISDSYDGRNGGQAIREIRRDGIDILTLDKTDLKRIVETGDAQVVFENKMDELYQR